MTIEWHIAQINISTALYPHTDTRMSRFFEQIDEINALADSSPGFVWRLQGESGNATDFQVDDDPYVLVNMSVWQSAEALFEFAYKSAHSMVLADRKKWFKRPDAAYQALWWVQAGHLPSLDEGMERLRLLQKSGPSATAFTIKTRYPKPEADGAP